MEKYILTINGGSSSIKFALYVADGSFARTMIGKIDRIGLPGSFLVYSKGESKEVVRETPLVDYRAAVEMLNSFLGEEVDFNNIVVVGHRIVHGMGRDRHAVVTSELIAELKDTSPIDPEHLPLEIAILETFAERHATLVQVACFDTVFHHDMPRVAQLLPIPRRFDAKGVRRYGFHGLSCSYLIEELRRVDPSKAEGRVIIAHLGNGASVTAVKEGKSVDTSMGFTPTGGIPMSSRTGDLDPGTLWYIMKSEGLSLESLSHLINHESGLLGISETSSNMYDLLEAQANDVRAKEAVDLFCYEVKKHIGAYAAAMGGVDTVIFTGGMGENAPRIRTRICAGLEFLGITIDGAHNEGNKEIISSSSAPICVRVMRTNEELMIARIASELGK
ncbi:MAG: acetate kinase [Candidatus Yonathbacteria bacterium RIFCSPLOWO2_01_FULL_47_33b]|uniref:Acetate kinase n=1 Tax=Candidatus Yonathbacteria bacterium RIFCSPLOWO2_01_FULL_47_33b TaxID=1802727 RepID=A0A1G2SGK2_9BACT|nr:MAG: acetate kinase [Candidatus Yonathbacteria bacterium RIFCSPLOWO2_01_FULL_47_33b]